MEHAHPVMGMFPQVQSMLTIMGSIFIFKDALHRPMVFNMDAIGKNVFFHNSVYVNDYGTNFNFQRCPAQTHGFEPGRYREKRVLP